MTPLLLLLLLPTLQCFVFPIYGTRMAPGNDELYYNPDLTPIINMWVEGSTMQKDEETRLIEERKLERLQDIILRQDMNQQKQKFENVLAQQNADIKNLKYMNKFMKDVDKDLKKNTLLQSKVFDPKFREKEEEQGVKGRLKQKKEENKMDQVKMEEEKRLEQIQNDLVNGNMEQNELMDQLNNTQDSSYNE